LDELDLALERLHLCGPEYGSGFSNHGPMACEALVALGHPALVETLVAIYAPRLQDLAEGRTLEGDECDAALGQLDRAADWIETFRSQIAAQGEARVLAEWLPRLLPAAFAAAGHGLLRTAHALRALERARTPARIEELAHGLGYWAATFQLLPGQPGAQPQPDQTATRILESIAFVVEPEPAATLISEAVRALDRMPAFRADIESLALGADTPEAILGEITRAAAALYLAHPELRILYAHALTTPAAMRLLWPYLEAADRRAAAGYALQCSAAIHATYGTRRADPTAACHDAEVAALAEQPAELRYRAACSVEEHAIKLTEACLREDALSPDPILRLAAADAAIRIGASRGARG
jgi:hypothetical protein